MPFFGKVRFLDVLYIKTLMGCVSRVDEALPPSFPCLPPCSWQESKWGKATGAASLLSDAAADELQSLV